MSMDSPHDAPDARRHRGRHLRRDPAGKTRQHRIPRERVDLDVAAGNILDAHERDSRVVVPVVAPQMPHDAAENDPVHHAGSLHHLHAGQAVRVGLRGPRQPEDAVQRLVGDDVVRRCLHRRRHCDGPGQWRGGNVPPRPLDSEHAERHAVASRINVVAVPDFFVHSRSGSDHAGTGVVRTVNPESTVAPGDLVADHVAANVSPPDAVTVAVITSPGS
jgi:hypothetical protein